MLRIVTIRNKYVIFYIMGHEKQLNEQLRLSHQWLHWKNEWESLREREVKKELLNQRFENQ
jgi:hypothetical protein